MLISITFFHAKSVRSMIWIVVHICVGDHMGCLKMNHNHEDISLLSLSLVSLVSFFLRTWRKLSDPAHSVFIGSSNQSCGLIAKRYSLTDLRYKKLMVESIVFAAAALNILCVGPITLVSWKLQASTHVANCPLFLSPLLICGDACLKLVRILTEKRLMTQDLR